MPALESRQNFLFNDGAEIAVPIMILHCVSAFTLYMIRKCLLSLRKPGPKVAFYKLRLRIAKRLFTFK